MENENIVLLHVSRHPLQVGLALSYAAPVVSLLNGFLTTFTETEKEMISVERVAEVNSIIFVLILIHHASLDITYDDICSMLAYLKKNSRDLNICREDGQQKGGLSLFM